MINSTPEALAATYPRFAYAMDIHAGYEWEAMEVTTEDDYILTTFHIKGQEKPTKGTVLIQHGNHQDGSSWITDFGDHKALHLQLVDAGYDVWIGNNRGTEYSQKHKTLDAADDSQYWDFTWAEMGLYDDPANILAVKEATGEDKIFYVGYSQGTIQMHYGLAHNEKNFHVHHLHKVVSLAPCFYPNLPDFLGWELDGTLMKFQEKGIYAINGPNWEEDLKKIKELNDPIVRGHFVNQSGKQAYSVKAEQHWAMNGLTNRFQEFNENWLTGEHKTTEVDVSQITEVPMDFFVSRLDWTCASDVAWKYIKQIKAPTHVQNVEARGHGYYDTNAHTEWFMEKLIASL